MRFSNLHTHTVFSDGAHTMRENVESAIQNNMLAAGYVNLTDQEMRWIRNSCLDKVRRSHGFISFEKALSEEKAAQ